MKNQLLLLLLIISNLCTSAQSGITWSASMNVAPNTYSNGHPRIVLDGSGNPLVLWGNAGSKKAMFSRWNGSSFTTPISLNPTSIPVYATSWTGPDIASKGDTVYVVYKKIPYETNPTYIVRSYDGGINFSLPVQVDFIADSISWLPTVATDASGNPLVAFMKLNSSFVNSRWVVTKSTNYGTTFSTDVKASGYSGANDACDCCPGAIVSSTNNVAMFYRDNLNNLRNMWAGISTDGGTTFPAGIGIDKTNWNVPACPASGPDGIIIGDSLYAVFMSSASGKALVYFSKSSISNLAAGSSFPFTGNFSGLSAQNYPRIANSGNAVAMVWQQTANSVGQADIFFTNNISNGFPAGYDTVVLGMSNSIENADVVLSQGTVHVVWEDNNSGTVKYRKGTFTPFNTGISNSQAHFSNLFLYPNPGSGIFTIRTNFESGKTIYLSVQNMICEELHHASYTNSASGQYELDINNLPNGIYILKLTSDSETDIRKIIIAK